MLRTHNCSQVDENVLGKIVRLCGWVKSRRDHGKIIFIDLRDRYGIVQAVFVKSVSPQAYQQAEHLRNEDVIGIKGEVNRRPAGTENPKIKSGQVEVLVKELEIFSSAQDLPFLIEEKVDVSEEIRLFHRYLDLRRENMQRNIALRHKLIQGFRKFLNQQEFLEIETPFLTRSTPEGARDFLIPSRLNPGKFYALPQSPQLFKQILMVAGFDRYYQIVRCFRDEDLRRDRQPEFSQLDLEMSFVVEEDIYELSEKMFAAVFKEALGVDLKVPFPRFSYEEAQEKYHTDKPNIESDSPFRFCWVNNFPLFKYNSEFGRWESEHHPFTSPHPADLDLLENKELSKVRSRSYDLILNGEEVGSGSIRIHSSLLQKKIFEILGIDAKRAEEKFGFLLRAFSYGVPPHGGIAFGLDRIIAVITGSHSIREVIAFPKTQKGMCLLSQSPAEVEKEQLREINIEIKREND